jgi:hypothetical protein
MTSLCARNWISYLMDALVNSGLPTREALEYLTQNLLDEPPNTRLHQAKVPYEAVSQFLHRLYGPIVEAVGRDTTLPGAGHLRLFTDISLISASTVLVMSLPENQAPGVLLIDSVCPWNMVSPHPDAFNEWAEGRYKQICRGMIGAPMSPPLPALARI